MRTPQPWYRLTLDLDRAQNLIGLSYEVRQDDETTSIVVLPQPGPFDTVHEGLNDILADVDQRYGEQLHLFPLTW